MIVSWNTTEACNLSCRHCYRDAGSKAADELTTAEAEVLLGQIAAAGGRIMIFSGGEPLLRPDIVRLIACAAAYGLRPVLGTNGTLLTLELAEKLQAAGLQRIGISLDFIEARRHDELRGSVGAWAGAVRAMGICRAVGLPFQLHTTVMAENKDELPALIDFAVRQEAAAHHFFFLVPTGRAEAMTSASLDAAEYEQTITVILRHQALVPIELKPTCAPQFVRIASQLGIATRFRHGCLAGTAYCVIDPHGEVRPCAYLDVPVGNVRRQDFAAIWRDSSVLKRLRSRDYTGSCGRCAYRCTCGGCRARAAFYNDGEYMAAEQWCQYQQEE